MRPAEKELGMKAFKEGLIQLLVATTVIEVGIDVPNYIAYIADGKYAESAELIRERWRFQYVPSGTA